MTGVYNHVWLAPYNMEQINEFQIEKKMNEHDKACVKGVISAASLTMFQNMIDGKTVVSMCFEQEGQTQLIFSGFIENMKVSEVGDHREVIMELTGLTQALDRAVAFTDYQDETKKNTDIIAELMKSYPQVSYEVNCKEETIASFLLQYEETDYEFSTRILSRTEEPIYTTAEGQYGKISFGLRARDAGVVLEQVEYEIFYEDGIQYKLIHDEYLDLGMQVTVEGQSLIVRKARYRYENGNSENEYYLGIERSCKIKQKRNEKIIGISLDGVIVDCKRDKVKVELNKTMPCSEDKRKWFAYSSPAASTDGSGWYCMPEKGEEIRLYCPTNDEGDAYVISAIRKKQAGTDSSQGQNADSKPENKILSNEEGQTVSFLPDGIQMACKDGSTMMSMNSNGTIEIVATKDVNIFADESVMMRAEQGMCIKATNKVTLTNDTGSTLIIDGKITENANRIKNNC